MTLTSMATVILAKNEERTIGEAVSGARGFCDRVVVMYAGQVVETGETAALIRDPRHPYTQGLLRSIPRLSRLDEPIRPIEGTVPEPIGLPAECRFRPRCFLGDAECRAEIPMRALAGGRMVRCIRVRG